MRKHFPSGGSPAGLALLAAVAVAGAFGQPAKPADEIQVYNAGVAQVGQLKSHQHLNVLAGELTNPPLADARWAEPNIRLNSFWLALEAKPLSKGALRSL